MQNTLRILIVDDDEVDRMAVRRAVVRIHKDVVIDEASDMASGLKMMKETRPDCAIVDYLLPDGDGSAFVRETDTWGDCSTPILILTGKGSLDVDARVMEAGAADYLEKDKLVAEVLGRAIRYAIRNRMTLTKVEKLNYELRELDRLKSEFLSTASHELRTPLTIIREYIALILDGITGSITPDQAECLNSALGNCDRLGNLINDILDLQRIESGRQRFRRGRTNIASLAEASLQDFALQCRANHQVLQFESDTDLPLVLCDPSKTTQVLVNLIGNACKFTPPKGTITVRARLKSPSSDHVTVEVEDTGVGISEEDQSRVFDRFTQIDRVDGPGAKGTGLGLAIVKNIVDLQDGTVSLESAIGCGSIFSFTLPTYSEARELVAFIKDRQSVVRAEGSAIAVTLIRVDHGWSRDDSRSAADRPGILRRLEQHIRPELHRKNDEVLLQPDSGILAIAAETNASGCEQLRRRIEQSMLMTVGNDIRLFSAGGLTSSDDSLEDWIAQTEWRAVVPVTEGSPPHRILIVDNDEAIAGVISHILKSSGLHLQVHSATDGYDGCLRFGEIEPDLLILDIKMPGFDGAQVLRSIRQNPRRYTTKILIISGYEDRFHEMVELGADGCLAKPFDPAELTAAVNALLNGTQGSMASASGAITVNTHLNYNTEVTNVTG